MSSPFTVPIYGHSNGAGASSPKLAPRGEELQGTGDVSVRPMRLKVLYTFDDENKTNCLARWPQVLNVRTAYLDETTQIGVIELKTCIQAIVSASPELVAKLGQDYTVYAYDYSEYETPLVGQGMLSWVLASSSSTPSAPAHLSRTVVTGRVCKNILGLFTSSSQETLEVKLRLVPVPTCLQSEYIESMRKYRDLSKIIPEGFDSGAWTSFLQANPAIVQLANQSRCQSPAIAPQPRDAVGLEHVQRLVNEGSSTRISDGQHILPQHQGYNTSERVEQLPRPASPASSVQSATAPSKRRGRPPRAASRTSARGHDIQPKTPMNPEPTEIPYINNDRFEEGPSKKRAKVSKADWTGSTGFAKQPDSLRVAASTAASVRIHQPTAVRLIAQDANNTNTPEGPPRAPTPIADPTCQRLRPSLPTGKSSLRCESYMANTEPYRSPYNASDTILKPAGSVTTSPEGSRGDSTSNTPPDIASSPPVYRGISTAPSSPNLPILPRHVDSGFMSGSIDDLFEDDDFQPINEEDINIVAQYTGDSDLLANSPGKKDISPCTQLKPLPAQQTQPDATSIARTRKAARCASGYRVLDRTMSSGNLAMPSSDKSDQIQPGGLYRSQSWSGQDTQPPSFERGESPQFLESSDTAKLRNRSGSGAGAKRKKAIQSRLVTSVAAGEMPPFCENCGAIETPTWRKAWVKVHSGTPEHVRISEEEGGIVAWETLQADADGKVILFRIIKRTLLPEDEGFAEILLCNPCGLWLHTRKCIRPREVWEKTHKDPGEKRKRGPRTKKQKTDFTSDQAGSDNSQGVNLQSDASSPANNADGANEADEAPQLPQSNRPRASSLQITSVAKDSTSVKDDPAAIALQRAIQSSPARLVGTRHSPIELGDLTPKPTRRVLFPSPTQARNQTPLGESSLNIDKKGPKVVPDAIDHFISRQYDQENKENCPPLSDLGKTGEHSSTEPPQSISCPITPKSSNKALHQLLKTPTKPITPERQPLTTGDFFSSAAKALFRSPITPKRTPSKISCSQPLGEMTPFTAQLNQILSEAKDVSPLGVGSFDFTSLPSFRNSPGSHTDREFDFSTFDPQDLLSTDVPMPSSPPTWFGVYEDPVEQAAALWSDFQIPGLQDGDEDLEQQLEAEMRREGPTEEDVLGN